jgi:hypothetical protein
MITRKEEARRKKKASEEGTKKARMKGKLISHM